MTHDWNDNWKNEPLLSPEAQAAYDRGKKIMEETGLGEMVAACLHDTACNASRVLEEITQKRATPQQAEEVLVARSPACAGLFSRRKGGELAEAFHSGPANTVTPMTLRLKQRGGPA